MSMPPPVSGKGGTNGLWRQGDDVEIEGELDRGSSISYGFRSIIDIYEEMGEGKGGSSSIRQSPGRQENMYTSLRGGRQVAGTSSNGMIGDGDTYGNTSTASDSVHYVAPSSKSDGSSSTITVRTPYPTFAADSTTHPFGAPADEEGWSRAPTRAVK
jgi:hypothetical protein